MFYFISELKINKGEKMKFAKTREVKSINRGTEGSAGLDFFIPKGDDKFIEDLRSKNKDIPIFFETENDIKKMKFQIDPHRDVLIPSGVHVNIPKDKVLIAFNKSGVATKNKLTIGACVIDSDYQGEVHIHLINQSDKSIVLEEDQKIAQFVLVDAWHGSPKEVKFEELYGVKTERGVGGFGSTNK
jgi:deoxyuridine 5'-triphosphate nucleotidohydrolase